MVLLTLSSPESIKIIATGPNFPFDLKFALCNFSLEHRLSPACWSCTYLLNECFPFESVFSFQTPLDLCNMLRFHSFRSEIN